MTVKIFTPLLKFIAVHTFQSSKFFLFVPIILWRITLYSLEGFCIQFIFCNNFIRATFCEKTTTISTRFIFRRIIICYRYISNLNLCNPCSIVRHGWLEITVNFLFLFFCASIRLIIVKLRSLSFVRCFFLSSTFYRSSYFCLLPFALFFHS